MLEVGLLCISFTPQCQLCSPVRTVAQGEIYLFHKYTDRCVDVVFGETNLTGECADRKETNFLWYKAGQLQRLLLLSIAVLQGVKKPSKSGSFNSASHQGPVAGLRKCSFTKAEDFVHITEQARIDIGKKFTFLRTLPLSFTEVGQHAKHCIYRAYEDMSLFCVLCLLQTATFRSVTYVPWYLL